MYHKVGAETYEGCPYFECENGKWKHMIVVLDACTQWLQAYPGASHRPRVSLVSAPHLLRSGVHPTTVVRWQTCAIRGVLRQC